MSRLIEELAWVEGISEEGFPDSEIIDDDGIRPVEMVVCKKCKRPNRGRPLCRDCGGGEFETVPVYPATDEED